MAVDAPPVGLSRVDLGRHAVPVLGEEHEMVEPDSIPGGAVDRGHSGLSVAAMAGDKKVRSVANGLSIFS